MFLEQFCDQQESAVSISAEQGSRFAKTISNDFNTIHDADSKRFCVPGDLLFALTLARYGVSQTMAFRFMGMVGADTPLRFPTAPSDHFQIVDDREKCYLDVQREGPVVQHADAIERLIKAYVYFSGQNFPHLLVPLMAKKNVMINPQRPLVIYESMALRFDTLDLQKPSVALADTRLTVDGKRGDAEFRFDLLNEGIVVGHGVKKLILSGLRDYQQDAIDAMVAEYVASQSRYSV